MNRKKLLLLILGLFLFHMAISSLFYYVSVKGYFPSLNNGRGIWNYARDSERYQNEAKKIAIDLEGKGFLQWWNIRPKHYHVKFIALVYKILKPVPLAAEPLNAVLWSASFLLIYSISFILLGKEKKASCVALIFSIFPSYLMDSIQLLKDPYYVFGVLLFILSWVLAWSNSKDRKEDWLKIILNGVLAGSGFWLVLNLRAYVTLIFVGFSLLFGVVSISYRKWNWKSFSTLSLIPIVMYLSLNNHPNNLRSCRMLYKICKINKVDKIKKKKFIWNYSNHIPRRIEYQFAKIARQRWRFCTVAPYAKSNIDTEVIFHNTSDIIKYIPRALEIGFFAPFPDLWFKPARKSGRISRLIVGFEMVILFLIYPGIFYYVYKKMFSLDFILLIMWGGACILILSLVVANLGTLHRMRHIYLLPFFIFGIGGWCSFLENFQNIKLKTHGKQKA